MSGFELVASLASSLAWPVVAIIILAFIWIKRNDISNLFNFRSMPQGRTLRRVRAGPVELEWDQLIESTVEQVSEVPATTIDAPADSVRKELRTIAGSVPAAAVLEAFARLEQPLRELYETVRDRYESTLGGRYSPRAPSVPRMARILLESGLISNRIHGAILNLNRLRNEAAHRVGGADITTDQAHEYLELVDRVRDYLKDVPGDDSNS